MASCVLQFACFKESWLGKFEQGDTWIFCLKAARIRSCAVASETVNARRSRRAAAHPANKVNFAHSGTSKRNRRVPHLRGEQVKSAGCWRLVRSIV
jgi:hypothetical protein